MLKAPRAFIKFIPNPFGAGEARGEWRQEEQHLGHLTHFKGRS